MTEQEANDFSTKFRRIGHQKDLINNANAAVARLTKANHNGSHQEMLVNAIDRKVTLEAELERMLKGKTYEDWKAFWNRLRQARKNITFANTKKVKAEKDLLNLKFN